MTIAEFWAQLDALVAGAEVVVDRPAGTAHPRYPEAIYPYDYGYLEGTTAADGGGIDVWIGSLPGRRLTAAIFTVDLTKRDAEVKLLLGCTHEEAHAILKVHNAGSQRGLLILREESPHT